MKHSIKRQFALIFGGSILLVILLSLGANSLLLEEFYVNQKEKALCDAYDTIEYYAKNDDFTSDEFEVGFDQAVAKFNIDILVMDSETNTVRSSVNNPIIMTDRLLGYIFNGIPEKNIIRSSDTYTIQKSIDPRMSTEYIELWGTLAEGKLIFMRTPVEGIKDSVHIANRFLVYVTFIILLFGIVLNYYITRRVTKPILELVDISEKMTNFDFDAKYQSGEDNEITLLGNHMNQLSESLEGKICELKTANNELQTDLNNKIEIDEMRKEFLSNISHELKTPIALIQGYSEGLKDCVNSDEESRDYYCDVIIDEAAKMNKLVKNLLELNQLECGVDTVQMERFDIIILLSNCLQSMKILFEQGNIAAKLECDEDSLCVWADEFKVEQVVNNYLSNAIHYCSNENKIVVKAKRIDERVRVSVFNTGVPIPEEAIPHLWTKLYKVDKARTREYGGSGIGLSIVKAIMESFNQEYGVTNYDNGVEFWFELDCKN